MLQLIAQAPADFIGTIEKPEGLEAFDTAAGGGENIGLLIFISNLVKVGTVVAGIWVMFNIIFAGWMYITGSGDSGVHGKVKDSITNSIIGLIVMVAAYTIMGMVGLLLFGRADYFLNPTLPTPGGP
jgi:hypothetical protein